MRRPVHRFFLWAAVPSSALAISALAIACATEATIPDPEPEGGVQQPDTGTDAPQDPDAGDAGVDAPVVACPDVIPDDVTGIYVAPTGVDSATSGTRTAPCKSVGSSVVRASVALRTKVYVARGTYVGKVTLGPSAVGIEVIGGWDVIGMAWKRACVTPEEIVILRAPAAQNITVEARDIGGETRLTDLRIDSKNQGQVNPGESIYGLVAVGTGASTTIVMSNVRVDVGNAGGGATGPKGDAGVDGGANCAAGTGLAGGAGTQGPGAPGGTYDPAIGYVPGTATAGTGGLMGADGTASLTAPTCVQCVTCATALVPACDGVPTDMACGKAGTNGCGGGPGGPGNPAAGGGSSIGVFVHDATVTIKGGKVKSGDGGNGGVGGVGGVVGVATKGAAGANTALCTTSCKLDVAMLTCIIDKTDRGLGGSAGGNGGNGGVGGAGGGGGGGSSFAIYQGGAGVVTTLGGATLGHGKAGRGGGPDAGSGATGAAADRLP